MTIREVSRACSAYAQRMKDPKNVLSTPVEWDFRSVTESELPRVLFYEYAREDKAFVERAIRWLGSRVRGKTVREHLLLSDDPEPLRSVVIRDDDGRADEDALDDLDGRGWRGFLFLSAHPLFPLPWLAKEQRRWQSAEANWRDWKPMKPAPVVIHPVKGLPPPWLAWFHYAVRIDFRSSKLADIVAGFETWARKEAKKQLGRKKLAGMASAKPFFLLKSLAALHLKKAGMTQAEAFRFVINHKARHPLDDGQTAVLPKFKETGGNWHAAIARASSVVADHWKLF